MSKITWILALCLLSIVAYGQENTNNFNTGLRVAKEEGQRMPVGKSSRINRLHFAAPPKATLQREFGYGATEDIIYDTPKGSRVAGLTRESDLFNIYLGYVYASHYDGCTAEYVIDQDTLYLKDPIAHLKSGTWLKGYIKGDTVSFPPQRFFIQDDDEGGSVDYYAINMQYSADSTDLEIVENDPNVKYVLRNDSLLFAGKPGTFLGVAYPDGGWTGIAEWNTVIAPNGDTPVVVPDDLTTELYILKYRNASGDIRARQVQVGFKDNHVYIGNIDDYNPDYYIRADIDGDKAVIPVQYLGLDTVRYNWHVYGMGASAQVVDMGDMGLQYDYQPLSQMELYYDKDFKSLIGDEDQALIVNAGKKDVSYFESYPSPELSKYEFEPGTPVDPYYKVALPYDGESGAILVEMPPYTTKGAYMHPDSLYYNIYFDDEKQTLSPDTYSSLDEPMTDIPYTYDDGWDIYVSGTQHTFFFYKAVNVIGVQLVLHGDGKTYPSNIVCYDFAAADVKGVESNAKTERVEFYDVSGRRVAVPGKGIYIKKEYLSDGSIRKGKYLLR